MLRDVRVAWRSRHASVLGRREVLAGRAKFGIFGDGKEVAQLAMAYAFERGDFRAGYYRDQTFMFALGLLTPEQFFAQLYAHADLRHEPAFGGRSMTGHFATRLLDERGRAVRHVDHYNSAADLSPTAAQMPKLVGLALTSKLYRSLPELGARAALGYSNDGNEIAFGTIGNASCAEGLFWEAVNAVGVLQAPMLLSIWDDGYGISVPNQFQMTKGDVSVVLSGFQRRPGGRPGFDIFTVPGWDYARLCETYLRSSQNMRRDHVPVIIHVTELTQPLGHSTSGSHERYKSPERLEWEQRFDCLVKMAEWMVAEGLASADELEAIRSEEEAAVSAARDAAFAAYRAPLLAERGVLLELARRTAAEAGGEDAEPALRALEQKATPIRRDLHQAAHEVLVRTRGHGGTARNELVAWRSRMREENERRYGSHLMSESERSALRVAEVAPVYAADAPERTGYEILNACFDAAFLRIPELFAMGEDVGHLGAVNQEFANLQDKYGELRVADTGIREATIMGQAIGMALRGLRPIAEIQYLDYILYALQILSDDLASLHWRTAGGQKAPVIIRTRGHRLEGIWHSGSPMAGLLGLCRGLWLCVPRDATQAAGCYNTLLESDDAAIVVEVLNGYRRKAKLAANIAEVKIPLGVPEVVRPGSDVTVVTYGACIEIAQQASERLARVGIEVELIDVRTLLPFDRAGVIVGSLEQTSRALFLDEDVPGGTTAYLMEQVLEAQDGYRQLDAPPRTLSAREHRPAYGTDGDYFSKPNREDVFDAVYALMRESDPARWPEIG